MDIWSPLAEGQAPRSYRAGQLIYLQGSDPTHFYYLISGSVKSYISSPDGNERTLTVHHAGDILGEASFFDRCPRVSSAVALNNCTVVSVDRDRLDVIFQKHPELALPMLQYLARTVRLLSSHVDDMSFLSAEQRIARYLLPLFAERESIRATHEEIGQAVGVSRVTVSRILSTWNRQQILSTGYGTLTLKNRIRLNELAQQEF